MDVTRLTPPVASVVVKTMEVVMEPEALGLLLVVDFLPGIGRQHLFVQNLSALRETGCKG